MQSLKVELHEACLATIEQKINSLKSELHDARESASEDTKSSAGDKFETSREMLKLEIDKLNQQLSKSDQMFKYLTEINPGKKKETVGFGSLVKTNEGIYYFSVGLGKVMLKGKTCFALSMASPIGNALRDRKAGEEIEFMGRKIKIEEVG